ncbi:hypothetical protein PUN28_014867 [Cardiocondyla obscurior]|uniref:Uncharacterized protein n=1 Tax=Cardiocondyla obscurior TaxID=286306 RepID=A0AAW2EYE3_9HYME
MFYAPISIFITPNLASVHAINYPSTYKSESLSAVALPVQIKGRRCAASKVDRTIRKQFTSRRFLRAMISRGSSCVNYRRHRLYARITLVRYRIGAPKRAHNSPETSRAYLKTARYLPEKRTRRFSTDFSLSFSKNNIKNY